MDHEPTTLSQRTAMLGKIVLGHGLDCTESQRLYDDGELMRGLLIKALEASPGTKQMFAHSIGLAEWELDDVLYG